MEVKKAEIFTKKAKVSAQEIAKTAASSMSAAGDREHSSNQAFITQDFLNELKALAKNITVEKQKQIPSKIEGICFVKLNFDDGRTEEYYITNDPVELSGIKFISQDSPLGKVLMGKAANSNFQLEEPPITGRVVELG